MDDPERKNMCFVSYREWRGAVSEAREEDKKMHLRKKVKKRQKWRMKADVDHAFGVPRAYAIENAKRAEYVPLCKRRVKTLRGHHDGNVITRILVTRLLVVVAYRV